MVWYAHRLSLLTNSLECCRHSKGRRVDARLSFPGRKAEKKKRKESLRAVSKRRRTETRIVSPLFPTDQYKHVSLYGPTNAASRNEIRAQLPDVTARCLLGLSRKQKKRRARGSSRDAPFFFRGAARALFFFSTSSSATREEEEERASEGRVIEAPRLTGFAKTPFAFVKNSRNATTVLDV